MICKTCLKDLGGHSIYCPESPAKVTKWNECLCFVHTCFNAPKKKPVYSSGPKPEPFARKTEAPIGFGPDTGA